MTNIYFSGNKHAFSYKKVSIIYIYEIVNLEQSKIKASLFNTSSGNLLKFVKKLRIMANNRPLISSFAGNFFLNYGFLYYA